jgi:hypothetical protein
MTDHGFSPEVDAVLRHEGWFPGRSVDVSLWSELFLDNDVVMHSAAREFLVEFGGIALDVVGPGVNMAKAPSQFDPVLCRGEGEVFAEWSQEIGMEIFPIGAYDLGRYLLGITSDGEVLLVEGWLASFGRLPQAIEGLVLGIRPRDL